jgi:hypothetical protein
MLSEVIAVNDLDRGVYLISNVIYDIILLAKPILGLSHKDCWSYLHVVKNS